MDRDVLFSLDEWKVSPYRKPLILKGARQVGKTWALKEFGRTRYDEVAYLSLENIAPGIPSEYAEFFEATHDPGRLLANLSLACGHDIAPGKTLLVLDEIQDCPAALGSLKRLQEEAPEYHVACAGSLLGVHLARKEGAFPVGKVEFLEMHPLSFSEFLRATGDGMLDEFANSIDSLDAVPTLFETRLKEQMRRFLVTGGMPEAVGHWIETGGISRVDKTLADLLDSYERDFAKHGGSTQFAKLSRVWHSLPAQLSRENKKFLYGIVREGARAREYEDAIEWLSNAGLLHRVPRTSAPRMPLSAYDDAAAFKLYCLDVGVLRRLSGLDASAFSADEAAFSELKGAFSENYVLQALCPQLDAPPRYWTNEKPAYEVNYVIQVDGAIVPVEVKSGEALKSPSLRYYTRKFAETTPLRVRFSLRNLTFDDGLLNIPLYLAHRAVPLIRLALGRI